MSVTKRTFLQGLLAAPALTLVNAPRGAQAAPAGRMAQAPGFYRFRVGDIEVTALLDGYTDIPVQFVIGYEEEAARAAAARAHHRFNGESLSIPVNSYIIRTGDETILLDAGGVTAFFPTLGQLMDNMQAAGFAPEDITAIILTHMHPDHIGTLVDADGNKVFANATLSANETEWGFIHSDEVRNGAPEEFRPMIDVARAALAPYAETRRMFSGEQELFAGVSSLPLPGHTPGQSGYVLRSNGESLLFWGDVIHFTALQFAHPEWGVVFDGDAEQARQTRQDLLARVAAEGMAVAGAHVDFPGIGYIEKDGDAFRYVAAPWMPV